MEDAVVFVTDNIRQRVTPLGVIHGGQHPARFVQRQSDMVRVKADA